MNRLKSNWREAVLHMGAVFVLIAVWSWGSTDWNADQTFDPGLESGKWAIRFLLLCLAMSPLNNYFNWRSAIRLRKPAGLWAFAFAVLHFLVYIREAEWGWLTFPMQPFIALGLLGLVILSALALTSNRWAMQRLRKNWKRLHRLVYLSGLAVVVHAILATSASKKIFVRDPQAIEELQVFLAVLVVLLVVRLALVRRILKPALARRQPQPQIHPLTLPDPLPEYAPKRWDHPIRLPLDSRLAKVLPEPEIESERVIVN